LKWSIAVISVELEVSALNSSNLTIFDTLRCNLREMDSSISK
jgi:hypothetical protein